MLLSAPQPLVAHEEWITAQEKVRTEAEDSLRELHLKLDGSEVRIMKYLFLPSNDFL